jgi:hypothetical protein
LRETVSRVSGRGASLHRTFSAVEFTAFGHVAERSPCSESSITGTPDQNIMNNGTHDTAIADRPTNAARTPRDVINDGELSQLKRELMQAEVRLAKARATVAGAEVDIKVLSARLKALIK